MTKAKYKIYRGYARQNGYSVAKRPAKVTPSARETLPFSQLNAGDAIYVSKATARDLRRVHDTRRNQGMRFETKTEFSRNGNVKGAYAIRTR